ncbi:hypothetical protein A2U01_0025791 [Trifolium medium]|uniref:Uncharacterized protein n=1 Tax=Trifolium medium TaxID=97028 RepID=A0A392NZ60_9FABA|nr:hypothetical protein [Trifolium medium]
MERKLLSIRGVINTGCPSILIFERFDQFLKPLDLDQRDLQMICPLIIGICS